MRLTGACVASSMPSVSTVRLGAAEAGWCAVLRTDSIVEVAMADDGRERLYASIDCEWASSKSVVVDVMNVPGCLLFQPGQDFDVLPLEAYFPSLSDPVSRGSLEHDDRTLELLLSSFSCKRCWAEISAQTEDLTSACSFGSLRDRVRPFKPG